ncbi:MAG: hypothetical protein MI754_13620 [Chromatiales bacterium]|nr:hypothetical protein [Chromatiales bacterium]
MTNAKQSGIKILLIVLLLGAGGFMGKLMFDMVSYMKEMTNSVVVMSQSVQVMEEKIVDMAGYMKSMNKNIDTIDDAIGHMNVDIHTIQTAMSEDLDSMRIQMEQMGPDIRVIAGHITHMDGLMNRMGYDIYRGTRPIASPFGMMQNMMDGPE